MIARADRGSATIWGVAMIALVAVLAGVAAAVAGAMAVRRTAETAADLAALAGARLALAGPETACRSAVRIAAANHATVRRCDVTGAVVELVVTVPAPGVLARFGAVTVRARAGPAGPNGSATAWPAS